MIRLKIMGGKQKLLLNKPIYIGKAVKEIII